MKPERIPGALKGTTLRLGARGERVRRLQLHLHDLGYDPGPADGLYGHLTFAAVRELQREFRFHADGTADRRVLAALSDEQFTNVRERIVVAELHESVSPGLAARAVQRHAASLSGIALPARVTTSDAPSVAADSDRPDHAGQRVPSASSQHRSGHRARHTAARDERLSSANPVVIAQKEQLAVWHTLHTRADGGSDYETGRLQRLLHSRGARDGLERQASQWLASDAGNALYLDLGHIAWGDGSRLLACVRRIGLHAERHGCDLVVSVPLRIGGRGWERLFKELDRGALASAAARIVLVPPLSVSGASAPPSPAQLSRAIREIVRDVPPWRCLLQARLGAVVLSERGDRPPAMLTYQQALALAYNSRTRPQWDETVRRAVFRCTYDGDPVTVWLENRYSIVHKLDIVDRWRLAGVYLSAIGQEDARIWGVVRDRWRAYRASGE